MELKKKIHKEYHKNMTLKYIQTTAIIPLSKHYLYQNSIIHPDGHQWIRLDKQAKYDDKGNLLWILNYDDKGNIVK